MVLVAEGTSDRRLLPILEWLVGEHTKRRVTSDFAERPRDGRPTRLLEEKVRVAVDDYECDLLFVHRDADGAGRAPRLAEIASACAAAGAPPHVPVIPIRMQEAWLLVDEQAIRQAADNPRGRSPLGLPSRAVLEKHADPKTTLETALRTAAPNARRFRHRRDLDEAKHRVVRLMSSYSVLRGLTGFDALEQDLVQAVNAHGLEN